MKSKPLTPTLPIYPSDLEQRLKIGERKLELYNTLLPLMEQELELMRELNNLN